MRKRFVSNEKPGNVRAKERHINWTTTVKPAINKNHIYSRIRKHFFHIFANFPRTVRDMYGTYVVTWQKNVLQPKPCFAKIHWPDRLALSANEKKKQRWINLLWTLKPTWVLKTYYVRSALSDLSKSFDDTSISSSFTINTKAISEHYHCFLKTYNAAAQSNPLYWRYSSLTVFRRHFSLSVIGQS